MCDSLPGLCDRYQTTLKPSASKDLPIICDSVTVWETYRGLTWKKNGDAFGLTGKVKTKKPLLTQGDVCHYVTIGGPSWSFPLHGYQGRTILVETEICKRFTKVTKGLIEGNIQLTNRFNINANILKLHIIFKTRVTKSLLKVNEQFNRVTNTVIQNGSFLELSLTAMTKGATSLSFFRKKSSGNVENINKSKIVQKIGSHYLFHLYSHFLIRFFSKCRQTSRFELLYSLRSVKGPKKPHIGGELS